MNPITEDIYYVEEDNKNMRIIISAPVEKPNVFQISKVETAPLFGLKRLTFAQDKFDPYTDGRDNIEYQFGFKPDLMAHGNGSASEEYVVQLFPIFD